MRRLAVRLHDEGPLQGRRGSEHHAGPDDGMALELAGQSLEEGVALHRVDRRCGRLDSAVLWPKAEIPSSRLWAAVVDRGAVAIVRPGQAAEGEAHRFYKAKMALIRNGLISESRGFVRLASAPSSSAVSEPTFQD